MRKKKKPVRAKSKRYLQYKESALQNAYASVQENKMTIFKASKTFKVPYMTLYDRIKGKIAMDRTIGRKTLLNNEQETTLATYFKFLFSIGYGYSQCDVLQVATDQLVHCRTSDDTDLENCKVGKMWYYNFLRRNRDVIPVRPHQKPSCATGSRISWYYEQLGTLLKQHGLIDKRHATYCMDKVSLSCDQMQANSGGDSSDDAEANSPEGNPIIVIAAGNASGRQLPPFFVFPGESKLPRITDVSPGASGIVSSASWADGISLKKYLFEHFLPMARSSEPDDSLVLLYDGHKFPLFPGLIEWAQDKKLFLFPLPPHAGLQKNGGSLLDKFEDIYTQEFQQMVRGKNLKKIVISKNIACQASCQAYMKTMLPEVLINYFVKCGIMPFNRSALPELPCKPLKLGKTNVKSRTVAETATESDDPEVDDSSSDDGEQTTDAVSTKPASCAAKRKSSSLAAYPNSTDESFEPSPSMKSKSRKLGRKPKPSKHCSSDDSSTCDEDDAAAAVSEEHLEPASVADSGEIFNERVVVEGGEQTFACRRVASVSVDGPTVIVEWSLPVPGERVLS